MWRFKTTVSASKNPRNLKRCIKISLNQRSRSTANRNIPTRKIGVRTYTIITVCTRLVQHHLQNYINTLKELVKQIIENLYVDDLITGRDKITDVQILKDTLIKIFKGAGFVLHKWHSNFPELEENNPEQSSTEQIYAKQQFGVKTGKTKMLGIKWDKKKDKINIEIPTPI